MPTLYVENVPEELYDALRARALSNRRSIAAETISVLAEAIPSKSELQRRARFYARVQRIRSLARPATPGPSTEQLLREDRDR